MASVKVTVTIPEEQLKEIQSLVSSGQNAGVSTFAKHAVRIALEDNAGWRKLTEESLNETGGPLTAEEMEWAEFVLGIEKKTFRKRKVA